MTTYIIGGCITLLALFTIIILAGDMIARIFTKPDNVDWDAVGREVLASCADDDRRGECPQCRDQDASIDSNGNAMCIECGFGSDW